LKQIHKTQFLFPKSKFSSPICSLIEHPVLETKLIKVGGDYIISEGPY